MFDFFNFLLDFFCSSSLPLLVICSSLLFTSISCFIRLIMSYPISLKTEVVDDFDPDEHEKELINSLKDS